MVSLSTRRSRRRSSTPLSWPLATTPSHGSQPSTAWTSGRGGSCTPTRTASPTPSTPRWWCSWASTRAAWTSRWSSARWRGTCTSSASSPWKASLPACARLCPGTTTCTCTSRHAGNLTCYIYICMQLLQTDPACSIPFVLIELLWCTVQIECLCEDGKVMFADGSCVVADSIIYCTGYDFSFPFLDTGGLVTVDDNRVGPLFEHTFPPALAPSLSFVGVPSQVQTPLFYEVQARWVAQALSGRRLLPPAEEMLRAAEEYHRAREKAGVPRRMSHAIFFDFDYCDEFGEKHVGLPRPPEWKKELMRAAVARLLQDTETFRDDYRDGDLVLESLRLEGWSSAPSPGTLNDKENGIAMHDMMHDRDGETLE
uniref:Flavin-containing monooxygenase n=1 Tax=Zea mays TaxID=4577 RepID=A0A804Q531_MAIZE